MQRGSHCVALQADMQRITYSLDILTDHFSFNSCNSILLKLPEYLLGEAFGWLNGRNIKPW